MKILKCLFVFHIGLMFMVSCVKKTEIISKEYLEMVEIKFPFYSGQHSSQPGIPIVFRHLEEEVSFECNIFNGSFDYYSDIKKLTVNKDEIIYWCYGKTKEIEYDYVEVIVRLKDKIIGYALIEINRVEDGKYSKYAYETTLLKSCIFPKIDGEYQQITLQYVQDIISEIKTKKGTGEYD